MCRIKLFVILLSFFVILLNSFQTYAFDYVINDNTFYAIPNTPRPAKGVPYTDPVTHLQVVRITDSPTETAGKINYAQPGYPKHDIENANGTMLLIQSYSGSCYHIYNANPPYNKIYDISWSLIGNCSPIDPRWDASDPNILYMMWKGLSKFNVQTKELTLIHDFKTDFPPRPGEKYPGCGATLQEEGEECTVDSCRTRFPMASTG